MKGNTWGFKKENVLGVRYGRDKSPVLKNIKKIFNKKVKRAVQLLKKNEPTMMFKQGGIKKKDVQKIIIDEFNLDRNKDISGTAPWIKKAIEKC